MSPCFAPSSKRSPSVQWIPAASQLLESLVLLSAGILFLLGAISILRAFGGATWDQRSAHLALLWVPFVIVNVGATWVGFLALSLVALYCPGYANWEHAMYPGPILDHIEIVTTVVIAALPVFAVVLILLGYYLRSRAVSASAYWRKDNAQGAGARRSLGVFLLIGPISLVGLFFYVLCAVVTNYFAPSLGGNESTILEVYRTSILRALPYLSVLVGPFAIAMDIIADVLFFLRPEDNHPASTRSICRRRFARALEHASRDPDRTIVVLAHSQGSAIATDLLAQPENDLSEELLGRLTDRLHLVTIGSPISSLYRRFLGVREADFPCASWVNGYRLGDYVGGPINLPQVQNYGLGPGGHTEYWSDPRLRDWFRSMIGPFGTQSSAADSSTPGPSS